MAVWLPFVSIGSSGVHHNMAQKFNLVELWAKARQTACGVASVLCSASQKPLLRGISHLKEGVSECMGEVIVSYLKTPLYAIVDIPTLLNIL